MTENCLSQENKKVVMWLEIVQNQTMHKSLAVSTGPEIVVSGEPIGPNKTVGSDDKYWLYEQIFISTHK